MKMNKEEKKLVVIFISVFIIINLIGYIGNIEILKILREIENGRVISFAPVFISLLLTAIYCIITKIIQKSKKVEFKQDLL